MGLRVGLLPVGPMSGSLLSTQDFTPEKKPVVRAPRRGPLPGRKKKVQRSGFVSFPHGGLGKFLAHLSMVSSHGPLLGVVCFWRRGGHSPRETPEPTDICLTFTPGFALWLPSTVHRAPPWRRLPCSLERDLEACFGNEMLGLKRGQGAIRGPGRERRERYVCTHARTHVSVVCVPEYVYMGMVCACVYVAVCVLTCSRTCVCTSMCIKARCPGVHMYQCVCTSVDMR